MEMEPQARVELMPYRTASEHIDGTWWPRSKQLAEELPGLVTSVSDRLGQVVMVGYRCDDWFEAPSIAEIDGRTIELLGFTSDEPASVIAIGDDGRHIRLQVIPPDVGEQVAQGALDETKRRADAERAAAAGGSAMDRTVAGVADKLARHEGREDEQRTRQIRRWCEEAARQFVDARVQSFVPILIEHIVFNRMLKTHSATPTGPSPVDILDERHDAAM